MCREYYYKQKRTAPPDSVYWALKNLNSHLAELSMCLQTDQIGAFWISVIDRSFLLANKLGAAETGEMN